MQEDYYTLKEQCLEQEQTMEELGKQLSISKLEVSEMREEAHRQKADGQWAQDKTATNCKSCSKEFNLTRRKVRRIFSNHQLNILETTNYQYFQYNYIFANV